MIGMSEFLRSREAGVLAASAVGGVLLGLGINHLMSRTAGKPKALQGGRMKLYHQHTYRSSRARWGIEGKCKASTISYGAHSSISSVMCLYLKFAVKMTF